MCLFTASSIIARIGERRAGSETTEGVLSQRLVGVRGDVGGLKADSRSVSTSGTGLKWDVNWGVCRVILSG